MVGVIYLYVDAVFMGIFCVNCLVGCFSMIVWAPALSSALYGCVLYFCICTWSAQLSMFHMERRSRNTLIVIIIIIIIVITIMLLFSRESAKAIYNILFLVKYF